MKQTETKTQKQLVKDLLLLTKKERTQMKKDAERALYILGGVL